MPTCNIIVHCCMKKIIFFILFFSAFLFFPRSVLASYPSYTDGSLLWSHLQDGPQIMVDDIFNEYYEANCTNVKWGAFKVGDMNSYFYTSTGPVSVYFAFGTKPNCEDSDYDYIPLNRYSYLGNNFLHLDYLNSVRFNDKTNSFEPMNSYQRASLDPRLPVVGNYVGTLSVYTIPDFPTTPFGGTYGNLGTISGSVLIAPATLETSLPIAGPPRLAPYRLRLRLEQEATHEVVYSTDDKCIVNMNAEGSKKPLQCGTGGSEGVIYYSYGGSGLYYGDIHLWVTNIDDPCSNLIASNYTLYDTEGSILCKYTDNPLVDDVAPPFSPPITFDPEAHDWGAFNWFKTVVSFFADMINGIAGWFYGLWRGLLDLIIPHPESLSTFGQDLKRQADSKFGNIDLSSLEALKNINENELQDVSVMWRGQEVLLIKYDWVKENIGLLRSVLIGGLGLFLILFNVNQVNKLLSDEEIT